MHSLEAAVIQCSVSVGSNKCDCGHYTAWGRRCPKGNQRDDRATHRAQSRLPMQNKYI